MNEHDEVPKPRQHPHLGVMEFWGNLGYMGVDWDFSCV